MRSFSVFLIGATWAAACCLLATSVTAVQLGQLEVFGPNCTGTPRIVPFLLADQCSTVSGAGFMMYNCSGNALQMYSSATCATTPIRVPFVCSPSTSVKYSCGEFPDTKAITFELGGSCDGNGVLAAPFLQAAVIVNTCLQDQRDASQGTTNQGYFKVTVDGAGDVLYTGYSDSSCTIGSVVAFAGKLDQCQSIPGGTAQIGAITFRTIAAGASIERVGGDAVSTSLNLALGAILIVASTLVLQ